VKFMYTGMFVVVFILRRRRSVRSCTAGDRMTGMYFSEGTGMNLETCNTVQTVLWPIVEPSVLFRSGTIPLSWPCFSGHVSRFHNTCRHFCQCTGIITLDLLKGVCILTCIRGFYPVAKLRSNSNWNLSCLLTGLWLRPVSPAFVSSCECPVVPLI